MIPDGLSICAKNNNDGHYTKNDQYTIIMLVQGSIVKYDSLA